VSGPNSEDELAMCGADAQPVPEDFVLIPFVGLVRLAAGHALCKCPVSRRKSPRTTHRG
jgi:hypothetical protein